jgi:hypothetical protein
MLLIGLPAIIIALAALVAVEAGGRVARLEAETGGGPDRRNESWPAAACADGRAMP